jgi:hypothetical protein
VLVTCKEQTVREKVSDRATDGAVHSWTGSRTEFLNALEPSPKDDWVRHALGIDQQ